MGSSKIQEYNLDPNMGLAKESTSQAILEKLTNGLDKYNFSKVDISTNSSSPTKVSGSGFILIPSKGNSSTSGTKSNFTLDGVAVQSGTAATTISTLTNYILPFSNSVSMWVTDAQSCYVWLRTN